MMKVPQFLPWVGDKELEQLKGCVEDNWITEGPRAKEFIRRILGLTRARYGVLAPNGTLALYLGLRGLGVGPGDEVIVPDFTFIGSATAVEMAGATPVFADVNQRNFQIDIPRAEKLVGRATKAIMPVHIYGTAADMDAVMEFAGRHKLLVIEDAAQAICVHYKGRHAGTMGHAGTFSFFADKTITTGEGGFILTNDADVYDKLLFLRNQGRKDRGTFIHPRIGYNFRMTDMQCAVGLAQLDKLPAIVARKKEVLGLYQSLLAPVAGVEFFQPEPGADLVPFRVCILCPKAHELMAFLQASGVEPRSFFYPLHKQPAFAYLADDPKRSSLFDDALFPGSLHGYAHGVMLPCFPLISDEQVRRVCGLITAFFKG